LGLTLAITLAVTLALTLADAKNVFHSGQKPPDLLPTKISRKTGPHATRKTGSHAPRETGSHASRKTGSHAPRKTGSHAPRKTGSQSTRKTGTHASWQPTYKPTSRSLTLTNAKNVLDSRQETPSLLPTKRKALGGLLWEGTLRDILGILLLCAINPSGKWCHSNAPDCLLGGNLLLRNSL
jgi:cytoskeletal protein RodZ